MMLSQLSNIKNSIPAREKIGLEAPRKSHEIKRKIWPKNSIFNWLQNYFKSFSKGLDIPISVEQKATNDNKRETRYEQHN